MGRVFKQFDTDGDGFLDMAELKRAFRAIGLEKRTGAKAELDAKTFAAMDTNGDGVIVRAPAHLRAWPHIARRRDRRCGQQYRSPGVLPRVGSAVAAGV